MSSPLTLGTDLSAAVAGVMTLSLLLAAPFPLLGSTFLVVCAAFVFVLELCVVGFVDAAAAAAAAATGGGVCLFLLPLRLLHTVSHVNYRICE